MKNTWTHLITATVIGVAMMAGLPVVAAAEATAAPPPWFGSAACLADPAPAVLGTAPTASRRLAAAPQSVRRAAQVTRSEKADVTFELRPGADGGIELSARSGLFGLKKTVQGTGDFRLELATDADAVVIDVTGAGATVTRDRTTVEQRRSGAAADAAAAAVSIRRLLADSDAVHRLRGVGAALLDAEDRSPASMALIMADAVLGLMTGDVGAVRRAARFLAQPGLSQVRQASMALDCFTVMEERMVMAWNDYGSCLVSTSPWGVFQDLCAWRWAIQVESYWFSFVSCSGFNW